MDSEFRERPAAVRPAQAVLSRVEWAEQTDYAEGPVPQSGTWNPKGKELGVSGISTTKNTKDTKGSVSNPEPDGLTHAEVVKSAKA
jgi:hypothetical protein